MFGEKMSRHSKKENRIDSGVVEVKTKFDAEFRRFSIPRSSTPKYEELKALLEKVHNLADTAFLISYTDPRDGDLLPINNDGNLSRAIQNAKPLLRLIIQRKGESLEELNGYGTFKHKNLISSIWGTPGKSKSLAISNPHDFRQVSSIIDVDIVPATCRRVKLVKHGTERPLGFYIRDGTSFRVTQDGMQKVPGIFISRLVPGGLAESTGLLAVNDEVLEVNGIEVAGKTLDQVTDMMVANCWNLIITVKPASSQSLVQPTGTLTRSTCEQQQESSGVTRRRSGGGGVGGSGSRPPSHTGSWDETQQARSSTVELDDEMLDTVVDHTLGAAD